MGVSPAATEPQRDWDRETPVFCFKHLQPGYDIVALSQEQKAAFVDKLDKMRQTDWLTILSAPRHGLGSDIIATASLNEKLPHAVTPDVNILAFRCFDMMPVLGFRRQNVFHVVWLDPNGKLYDH